MKSKKFFEPGGGVRNFWVGEKNKKFFEPGGWVRKFWVGEKKLRKSKKFRV